MKSYYLFIQNSKQKQRNDEMYAEKKFVVKYCRHGFPKGAEEIICNKCEIEREYKTYYD